MKKISIGIAILAFLAALAGNSLAAHVVTAWPDNRSGAVSLAFDDGCTSHRTVAVPALEARGFKGSFFLITGDGSNPDYPDWDAWRTVAALGHEIASHSMTHADLTAIPIAEAQAEMSGAKAIIDTQIPGQNGITFAYPYGYKNTAVEAYAETVYIGSKDVLWGTTCSLNGGTFDFGNLVGCSYDDGFADVYAGADAAEAQGKWLDVTTHTVNGGADGCWGDWTATDLTDYLDYLLTKDLYVDTFASLVKYSRERVNATLSVVSSSATQIVLSLTDTLDNAIYDRPLTIRSDVPADWLSVTVAQDGASVQVDSAVEGTTRAIYFDAVPDLGNITLTVLDAAPQISGLSPPTVTAGSPGFTLEVAGSGFASGAAVRLNGSARATTFVSSAMLRAAILATDVDAAGTIAVTVVNPDATVSNASTLTVTAAVVPLISGLSPQAVTVGSPGFTLDVTGSGFVSGATVRCNGSARTTTFVSSTLLRAEILATDVDETGSIAITVVNPDTSVSNTPTLTVGAASTATPGGGGGGCTVAGNGGGGGIADFASAYGSLVLLVAWLGFRKKRNR